MMKFKNIFLIFAVASAFASCTQDQEPDFENPVRFFEVKASIDSNGERKATRAETYTENGQDGWSFTRFSARPFGAKPLSEKNNPGWTWEEALGFFSAKGNNATGSGFVNEKMIYSRSLEDATYATFISAEMDVDLNGLKSGSAAYFPYVKDIENEGLELRWVKNGEDLERCIDGLIVRRLNTDGSTVSGLNFHFYHAFSEMLITRGEGFDNPPAGRDGITVVMTEGYSHAVIEDYVPVEEKQSYFKNFRFVYNPAYSGIKTQEECKRWDTWKTTYSFTQSGTAPVVRDAWFVLLPGGFDVNRPSVDYIEIYDNYGTLHKITDFNLFNNDGKRLNWNERYILEIKMEGLNPTVSPVIIEPWGEDVEIAQREAAGISTLAEYQEFVTNYNSYGTRRNNRTAENVLKKYGDLTTNETDGEKYWHFYITDDIDFGGATGLQIASLHQNDVIDGLNSNIHNIREPLFGDISGTLQSLNMFVNISDANKTGNVGAVTGTLAGNVLSCTVYGTLNVPHANVGLLAGSATDGAWVKNCIFSGLLIGTSSFDRIIGASSSYGSENNSCSGVIF